ncbi:hypothetical protein FJT64_015698 [Amphibalanus amphitrite]|uniref:G-protein coupled receptors family 1 profile domain-containing protein n=1 Tax=Amphibalanus amphitrite TaxID=1232801 RepID=A0A6A4X3D3_AMPAM|nr:hypothetical protein FJT64_015698 [Amphibalanus amphitrite]
MSPGAAGRPDTVHNLTCPPESDGLRCHRRNPSLLVCSAEHGDHGAALLFSSLITLTSVIVPLAVVLNLTVVVVVLLNRKLHTIINVLVVVLGINNVAWTGLPILLTVQAKVVHPALCSLRAVIFIVTRGVSFTVIITITVLRYMMVVRNRSYPASRRNVLAFVCVCVLPAVVKWLIRRGHQVSACRPIVARNPDGFIIIARFEKAFDLLTSVIATVEYGGGLGILMFCYIGILAISVRSRRRVQEDNAPRGRWADRAARSLHLKSSRASESQPQAEPSPGAAEVVLQPSRLLSRCSVRRAGARRPRVPVGRVDVVTMFSMTVLIATLFVVIFPYVLSIGFINRRAACVMTAEGRLLVFIINVCSMGFGAVVGPVVLVLFSVDFRQAFWSTCGRGVSRGRSRQH